MATGISTTSTPELNRINGLAYNAVLHREKTPELRSPNKVDHKDLQIGKYYYILDVETETQRRQREQRERGLGLPVPAVPIVTKYIGKVTFVPTGTIDYILRPPRFKEVLHNGTLDSLSSEVEGPEFEFYLCKNKKCQDTGAGHSEQSGGKSKKRYPKTKRNKYSKKVRGYSRKR